MSAAIAFLKDSAGKSEKALFLDATMGGLITSIRGRQSMLALGSINFANTPGTPDIQIVKETNHVHATGPTGPYIPVGGPVVWDYTVTNTGTVPLRNVVVIDNNGTPTNPSDDFFPTFQGGDANGNGLLDIGESWTFTATGTAVGGQYGNTGTVTAESPTGTPVTDSDLGFYFGAAPAVELVKLTNGSDYDSGTGPFVPVGSTVTWTYNVTNTGNVALSDVVVVDDNGTPTNTADDFTVGTLASLAPGASATLTATGIAVAGQYGNIGSASGIATFTSGGTRTVSATNPDHYFGAAPDLQLVKLTNGRDNNTAPGVMVSAGSTVTWTYNVTNTGNVTLSDIIVVDDNGTPLDTGDDFTVGTIASLAPGASATLTATGIAVAGQYGNVGTAKGTDIIGETVTAQDVDNYFTPASLGDFVWYDLNANGLQDSGEPGVANVTVQLLDSSGTNVLQTTATDGSGHYGFLGLTPSSYTVRFLPPDGQVFTTRDVSADTFDSSDSDANPATGMTAVVALAPGETHTTVDAGLLPIDLSLVKTVNNSAPNVGSNVTFTLAISNAVGLSAASGVAVLDVLPAGLTFVSSSASQGSYSSSNGTWTVGNLASGGNATLTIIATVSVPSTAPSPLTNTAEVSAADQPDRDSTPNNRNPTEDDQSSVTVTPQLIDLSLVKTVDDAAPHIGQNVTFTITLGNAAGFSLATGVHVVDLLPAGLLFVSSSATPGTYNSTNGDWAVGTLAGGTSATLTITAGVMTSGTLVNTAEVTTADQPDVDSTPNNHVPTEDDQSSVTLKPEICDLHDFTNITYLINGCKTVNDLRGNVHQGDWVQVTFTVAPGVTDLLSFVSYTAPGPAFDPATASQQVVFDVDSGIFGGGTHTLMVRVPNCYFQIDFVCGPVIEHLGPAGTNNFYSQQGRLIGADNGGTRSCSTNGGSISGQKFEDHEGNGVRDAGDQGLGGWTMFLDTNNNGRLDPGEVTSVTAPNGSYRFSNLAPGTYVVREVQQNGWTRTTVNPAPVSVLAGAAVSKVDFGNFKLICISGQKFNDRNGDGNWDPNGLDNRSRTGDDEVPLANWKIFLDANDNGVLDSGELSDVTDCNGNYSFSNLGPGIYHVREVMKTGWIRTTDDLDVTATSGQDAPHANIGNFCGNLVRDGDTATIGFWNNKNGQALIRSFNGSLNCTNLGTWLATQFPNMYGKNAGSNNLSGKTNDYVANYLTTLINMSGQNLEAQTLGSALAVYTTTLSLSGKNGSANPLALSFGFTVTSAGVGADFYNIGDTSAAFSASGFATLYDDTALTVMDILKRTNANAANGVLWAVSKTLNGKTYTAQDLRCMANTVFTGINATGDIV